MIDRTWLKRVLACAITASLLWTMPGIGVYEALANTGIAPIAVQAPVGGGSIGSAGAGRVNLGTLQGPGMGSGLTGKFDLKGTLAPLGQVRLAPSGTPALSLPSSAIQAAPPAPGLAVPQASPSPAAAARVPASPASAIPAAAAPSAQAGSPAPPQALPLLREGAGRTLGRPALAAPRREDDRAAPSDDASARSESLHAFRGVPNRLDRHFVALRAEFARRGPSGELSPGDRSSAGFEAGRAVAAASVEAGRAEGAAARPGPFDAAQEAALAEAALSPASELKPPTRLTLRSSGDASDLGFVIDEEPAAAAVQGARTALLGAALDAEAPAPPSGEKASGSAPKVHGWMGLGKAAVMFIASLVVGQVGAEALGAAMPALIQRTFGDFTVVAQLSIFFTAASIIGRQFGPMAIRRLGLKKAYLVATGLKMATISLMAGLLATGSMTLPLMMAFYAVNGLFSGISLTAMESVPPAVVGQDPARLEKFWTWDQTLLEIIGITGPIATGAVVASFGFIPALVAFPLSTALSLAIVAATVRIPRDAPSGPEASAAGPKPSLFSKMARGARLVWEMPALRYSFLAFTFYMTLNPLLYTMLGPAYGLRLAGPAAEELATGIMGWLTGLYSLGGLFGGFLMMREQRNVEVRKAALRKEHAAKNGAISDKDWAEKIAPWEREVLRKSMLRWLLYGTAGLASIATLMFPLPALGALVSLPGWLAWLGNLTLPALALIPFGMAQVVSVLKLRAFFQSRVPSEKDMPEAMGFFGAASVVVDTSAVFAAKFLFQAFPGFTPFVYIAAAMLPLGALYLYLRHQLANHSAPTAR